MNTSFAASPGPPANRARSSASRGLSLVFLGVALVSGPEPGQAGALRVDPHAPGCGDGSGDVYCAIQSAIDAASPDATIEIAAGTINLWGEALIVNKSLTLRGAGAAVTVLDGGGQDPQPIVSITAEAESVQLYGLSLVNRIRSGSAQMGAGAIDHQGGDLTVADVEIRDNQGGWGGAVRIRSEFGAISFTRVAISDNTGFTGGAIAFYDGPGASLEISSSELRNNSAIFSGGGLFLRDVGEISLKKVVISGNRTGNTGGGIHMFSQTSGCTLALSYTTISGNASRLTGGISVTGEDVEVVLDHVMIAGNKSDEEPALADCSGGGLDTFRSLGANRIGVSDGCRFPREKDDAVGTAA
ncbi:MAG: hypothetical protein ACR2RB_06630, partial [Gammaproteobacteria bacterium]